MATTAHTAINEEKVHAFLGKVIGDWGATLSSALVVIGDKLGLYKAMAGSEPLTSEELAQRTGTSERYGREWLINQAASGYLDYDAATQRYSLPAEHAIALTDDNSPFAVAGGFHSMIALAKAEPASVKRFGRAVDLYRAKGRGHD